MILLNGPETLLPIAAILIVYVVLGNNLDTVKSCTLAITMVLYWSSSMTYPVITLFCSVHGTLLHWTVIVLSVDLDTLKYLGTPLGA